MNGQLTALLNKLYYKSRSPASYTSADKLLIEVKKQYPNIKRKDIQEFLDKEFTYSLHKNARKNFKRNPVVAEYPLENFQADLIDVQRITENNDGYRFVLAVIDVFTKKAWAHPMKNKKAETVVEAMEFILKNNIPIKLQTDKGKEFENKHFKFLMKKYGINHFFSKSIKKCANIEIFNKTLKNKLQKNYTKRGKEKFTDLLQDSIDSYNDTHHSVIDMDPNDVNLDNKNEVFQKLYDFKSKREMLKARKGSRKLSIGDTVRIKYDLKFHEKGYLPNWTDRIFTIYNITKGVYKPYYHLEDEKGKKLDKRFYQEELQKIDKDILHLVEKIVGEKSIKGKKYYKVRWKNHDESFDSWINSRELVRLS